MAWDRAVPGTLVLAKRTSRGGAKGHVSWAYQEPGVWDSRCALASQGSTLRACGLAGSAWVPGDEQAAGAWGRRGMSQTWQEVTFPPKAQWWTGSPES